jgi:SP family xylose:H+ symportor-like MFS transporter
MVEINNAIAEESPSLKQLLKPGMRIALFIGIALAVLQQVVGINVFLYYAPEIFKSVVGTNTDIAMMQTVVVGGVNLVFTIIAIWSVDKLGRKPLMYIGSAGMGISLVAAGFAFVFHQTGIFVLVCVLCYIASFAMSVGPVVWVILSEIFPTKIRGRAMAIATFFLWVANFIVSQTFPMMNENKFLLEKFNHGFPFFIYSVFCVVLIIVVWKYVPETKGKSLEEIEKFWKK